jgi:uncharacterized FlaG/YvyC family protein
MESFLGLIHSYLNNFINNLKVSKAKDLRKQIVKKCSKNDEYFDILDKITKKVKKSQKEKITKFLYSLKEFSISKALNIESEIDHLINEFIVLCEDLEESNC